MRRWGNRDFMHRTGNARYVLTAADGGRISREDAECHSPGHHSAVWVHVRADAATGCRSHAELDQEGMARSRRVAARSLYEDGHAGADYVLTGPESLSQAERVTPTSFGDAQQVAKSDTPCWADSGGSDATLAERWNGGACGVG
jgi:hypothetical protein